MTLFRMTYLRDGKPRGTTFVGKSPEWAATFAEAEQWGAVEQLARTA